MFGFLGRQRRMQSMSQGTSGGPDVKSAIDGPHSLSEGTAVRISDAKNAETRNLALDCTQVCHGTRPCFGERRMTYIQYMALTHHTSSSNKTRDWENWTVDSKDSDMVSSRERLSGQNSKGPPGGRRNPQPPPIRVCCGRIAATPICTQELASHCASM